MTWNCTKASWPLLRHKCKYIARHNNRMRCISKTRLPSEHDSKHVIKKQYPHTWRMTAFFLPPSNYYSSGKSDLRTNEVDRRINTRGIFQENILLGVTWSLHKALKYLGLRILSRAFIPARRQNFSRNDEVQWIDISSTVRKCRVHYTKKFIIKLSKDVNSHLFLLQVKLSRSSFIAK